MSNLMFQIALPLFRVEPGQNAWKCIEIPAPFLDYTDQAEEPIEILRWLMDLSCLEKEYKVNQVSAQFDPEVLKNLVSVPLPGFNMDDFFK